MISSCVILFLPAWLSTLGAVDAHWIGFSDQSQEGGYTWSDYSPVSFVNWNEGEPNNYGDGEDCGEIVVGYTLNGAWNDDRCEKQMPAVCEKRGQFLVTRMAFIYYCIIQDITINHLQILHQQQVGLVTHCLLISQGHIYSAM